MIHTADLAWIAGFLEGKGLWGGSMTLSAVDVNQEPLGNLHAVLGGHLYHYVDQEGRARWRWIIQGSHAIGVALTLYHWLSRRRRRQVQTMVEKWKTNPQPRHHVMAGAPTEE